MRVIKFGGTSVGTLEALETVRKIVLGREEDKTVVVVSALGGITDKLLLTASLAADRCPQFGGELKEIAFRHREIVRGLCRGSLIPSSDESSLLGSIASLQEQLENLCREVYLEGELSEKARLEIVSFGERMSSRIVADMIPEAKLFDSLELIKTKPFSEETLVEEVQLEGGVLQAPRHEGMCVLDSQVTDNLIRDAFRDWDGKIAVVPGFISTDSGTGEITNLGRGGSDYTASILAAALGAECLEIWTDVDGFMTADPKKDPSAVVIDRLSFCNAMEMCNRGAKVIYPPALYPVCRKDIPILIKNTFNPSCPGTIIRNSFADKEIVLRLS